MSELAAELQDWIEEGLDRRNQWDSRLVIEVRALGEEPNHSRVPAGFEFEHEYEAKPYETFACAFRLPRRAYEDEALLGSLLPNLRALFANEWILGGHYESGYVGELDERELMMTYGRDKPDRAYKVSLTPSQ